MKRTLWPICVYNLLYTNGTLPDNFNDLKTYPKLTKLPTECDEFSCLPLMSVISYHIILKPRQQTDGFH